MSRANHAHVYCPDGLDSEDSGEREVGPSLRKALFSPGAAGRKNHRRAGSGRRPICLWPARWLRPSEASDILGDRKSPRSISREPQRDFQVRPCTQAAVCPICLRKHRRRFENFAVRPRSLTQCRLLWRSRSLGLSCLLRFRGARRLNNAKRTEGAPG